MPMHVVARYGGPNSNTTGPSIGISGPLGTSLPVVVLSQWSNGSGLAFVGSAGVGYDDTGLADLEIGEGTIKGPCRP